MPFSSKLIDSSLLIIGVFILLVALLLATLSTQRIESFRLCQVIYE